MDDKRGTRGRVAGHLMLEAMVSAGPRKSPEEYRRDKPELCEDAAGYLTLGDYAIFWVCDGTSDSNALPGRAQEPGFNSRILAADLGQGFGRVAVKALLKGEEPKVNLPRQLLEDIALEWRGRLIEYLGGIESDGKLPGLLSRLPKMGDGSYRMKWSSTLLGGIYNTGDQTLDILNIGDCGAVVLGERAEKVAPKETCGIIVANMRPGTELEVTVTPIEVEADWEHFEGVTSFIAVSDGVAKDLGAFLSEIQKSLTDLPLCDVRKRLITAGALTYDDRAMVIGTFLEKSREEGESHTTGWVANALLSVRRAFS